jgi:alpha-glucosidase
VDRQQGNNASMLHYYTRLLQWRRGQAALTKGSMEMLPRHEQVVAFVRTQGDERLLCLFNFSAESARWEMPAQYAGAQTLPDSPVTGGEWVDGVVQLQPWGGMVVGL